MKKIACPICGKPPSDTHKPFCSQGCRDRDLLQWLGEGYRIPVGPADPEAENASSTGLDTADNDD
jgi:endogenous inhibitor of DNA gyrase (YacG/DUF329 family)